MRIDTAPTLPPPPVFPKLADNTATSSLSARTCTFPETVPPSLSIRPSGGIVCPPCSSHVGPEPKARTKLRVQRPLLHVPTLRRKWDARISLNRLLSAVTARAARVSSAWAVVMREKESVKDARTSKRTRMPVEPRWEFRKRETHQLEKGSRARSETDSCKRIQTESSSPFSGLLGRLHQRQEFFRQSVPAAMPTAMFGRNLLNNGGMFLNQSVGKTHSRKVGIQV
ncbi:hypothetical protein CPC08DRAFT_339780 [Agrocybe pediades]|nr:hypothetical protein CPC08DRAFT_339780 [Agrocybe pediades]